MLSLCIRPLLNKMISPNQAAFVPGRWIGENSLLVNEITHSMKTKKGNLGFVGIKFDMHKAYDRINWEVSIDILIIFGFSAQVVSLLSQCYSINNVPFLLMVVFVGALRWKEDLDKATPSLCTSISCLSNYYPECFINSK